MFSCWVMLLGFWSVVDGVFEYSQVWSPVCCNSAIIVPASNCWTLMNSADRRPLPCFLWRGKSNFCSYTTCANNNEEWAWENDIGQNFWGERCIKWENCGMWILIPTEFSVQLSIPYIWGVKKINISLGFLLFWLIVSPSCFCTTIHVIFLDHMKRPSKLAS